jgi:ParB-like chromosome segregation protein Spo0J
MRSSFARGKEVDKMPDMDVFAPLSSLQWVERDVLKPNDYNPNKVSRENLALLTQSIITNGWTLPIVVRPDMTIIDGFHRWTVAGEEPLFSKLGGKVPVVIVAHTEEAADMYGTITHNRARGTHLLEPMKAIVKKLIDEGKEVSEISKQLGMRPEEVFRLSDFTKEDFLALMTKGVTGYSKAEALAFI